MYYDDRLVRILTDSAVRVAYVEGSVLATSGGRLSLFWRVNAATGYTMLVGAGAWALARGAQDGVEDAVGSETVLRSVAGVVLLVLVFFGIAFVVSLVTYGALLRNYTPSPPADRPGGGAAVVGAAPSRGSPG